MEGNRPDIRNIPAQLCVITTHIGMYEDVHLGYSAIGAWMADHLDYHMLGPAVERYLKGEESVQSPEAYEAGILFLVETEANAHGLTL